MNISHQKKILLLSLLILLNILIRIPSLPHEIGVDSFSVHALANSISLFNEAKYWIHPLAFIGMYPYTYASAVPFLLSDISQLTDVDMEMSIRLYGTIVGLFSMLTAYLLAGKIINNEVFKFFVAFLFSISPGVLYFSTWDATTRGFFIILLPLFIFLLLQTRSSKTKYGILTIIIFMLLFATHKFIFYTIPIIASFTILIILEKYFKYIRISNKNLLNLGYLALLLIFFSFPFFTRSFFEIPRYDLLWRMIALNTRFSGILIFFAIGGFIYISMKHNKDFGERFLLLCILFLSPFSYIALYTHFINIVFICLLVCIAMINIADVYKKKRKYVATLLIFSLLLFVSFSGFYQHWRSGISVGGSTLGRTDWYMDDSTYTGSVWIKDYVSPGKKLVGNGGTENFIPKRMLAASGGRQPILVGEEVNILAYGFINESKIKVNKTSPLSTQYYMEGPYEAEGHSIGGELNWLSGQPDIDSKSSKDIIEKFDLSYMIEDSDIHDDIMSSIKQKKNKVYDIGYIRIWDLG